MDGRTRYARSGDLHIAYRTLGSGPIDIVVVEQWFSNVELERTSRRWRGSTTDSPPSAA